MKRDQIDKAHETDLYDAILQLQTIEEVESFFLDLCTPAEREGLTDRWRVAQMLVQQFHMFRGYAPRQTQSPAQEQKHFPQ